MKKLLLVTFAVSLIFGFVSCKSSEQENTTEEVATEVPETEQETEAVTESEPEPEQKTDISVSERNKELMATLEENRTAAIEAGAEKFYDNQLNSLDETYKDLQEKVANSEEDLSVQINDLNYKYLALQKASETKTLKSKIEEHGFDQENKVAYDAAEVLLEELEKVIAENADGRTAYKSAETTYAAYHTIYYNSFKKLADKERASALEQKKNADNVKAGVAQKERYKTITDILKKGDSSYVTKNPEGAYDNYKDAKEKFEALATEVAEKREAAQKRIDEAKEKVQNVEDFATEADDKAPIGEEKIDGIEEKDTVLLEEDEFEHPDASVIEVDETVEVENDGFVEVFKDAVEER